MDLQTVAGVASVVVAVCAIVALIFDQRLIKGYPRVRRFLWLSMTLVFLLLAVFYISELVASFST